MMVVMTFSLSVWFETTFPGGDGRGGLSDARSVDEYSVESDEPSHFEDQREREFAAPPFDIEP